MIALLSSLVSAVVAAVVAILTTRYTLKHGPNYTAQINGLHDTIESLAKTQEELRKQQAEQAEREDARYQAELKRLEGAKWKPEARIINVNEGQEHVNKLSIISVEKFRLVNVSLLSETGAKVYDFGVQMSALAESVVGQNVPIPHTALNKLAAKSPTYFRLSKFEGAVQFTVERAEGEETRYTGEIKFTAESVFLGNTLWFDLVG